MALSSGNNYSNDPLIFLTCRSRDKEDKKVSPHFEIARVGDDKKIAKTGESCTKISGDLRRPKFSTREWNGEQVKHVTLYIHDQGIKEGPDARPKETYCLDLTYRIASRQLFNAVIGLTNPNNVQISIYENKGGYEALSLWQDDKMAPWKFDGRKGEIPKAIESTFRGKIQRDFTPTDNFFDAELRKWADAMFGPEKAGKSGTATAQQTASTSSNAAVDAPAKTAQELAAAQKSKVATNAAEVPEDSIPF